MRIRRTFPIFLTVVLIVAAVILAVQLRKHAPPEPARLLPGADAYVYVNLGWIRKANSGKELPAVCHDPEYERFIRETGFQFERDLDEAAFAVHYPANWPSGGTGGSAPEPRFSEVLVGKFHGERLTAYLRQIAQSIENYESVDIFTIRVEGRSLRVALLSADSVAVSNHDDPAVIRGMVDRSKRLASPFGGRLYSGSTTSTSSLPAWRGRWRGLSLPHPGLAAGALYLPRRQLWWSRELISARFI
jgi:hypothetical protein